MSSLNHWILIGQSKEIKNKQFVLISNKLTIGRTSDNDIVLTDKNTSRHHAMLELQNHNLFIEDLNSKNGITVNRQATKKQNLKVGDIIHIGESVFKVHMENNPEQQHPLFDRNIVALASKYKKPILLWMASFLISFLLTKFVFSTMDSFVEPKQIVASEPKVHENINIKPKEPVVQMDQNTFTQLLNDAQTAVNMSDHEAAFMLYSQLSRSNLANEKINTMLKRVSVELEKNINRYDENAMLEYEKLNFDLAISHWEKALNLAKQFDPVIYKNTQKKIEEAKTKQARTQK